MKIARIIAALFMLCRSKHAMANHDNMKNTRKADFQVASSFTIARFDCEDRGIYESYCPRREYPGTNRGFVPTRSQVQVKDNKLVPKYRRESRDVVGLRFEYVINCHKYNLIHNCIKGDVTIVVHPSAKWDRKISWASMLFEVLVCIAFTILLGPFVLFFICFFPLATAPDFKTDSYFSDD